MSNTSNAVLPAGAPPIPEGLPVPAFWPPPSDWWELVVVAVSDGKDSRVLLHRAYNQYPRERILVVYNLLGNEHPGSPQEVADWCRDLSLPLLYTWKDRENKSRYGKTIPPVYLQENTLDADLVVALVDKRGKWPSRAYPLCTSTGKRDPTNRIIRSVGDKGPRLRRYRIFRRRRRRPGFAIG